MKSKILTYVIFVLACILVVLLFVTATTYTQLALAVVLYPALAFFALKIFSRKPWKMAPVITHHREKSGRVETMDILDIDKRTFLKLVGATGLFFFVTSLLGKWASGLPFTNALNARMNNNPGNSPAVGNGQGGSLAANGYQISEIDDGTTTYYGFTNVNGSWLIMKEETETSSFRYAKGASNFPGNWANRKDLKYDYYYNLF